jgi:hypothetical protein
MSPDFSIRRWIRQSSPGRRDLSQRASSAKRRTSQVLGSEQDSGQPQRHSSSSSSCISAATCGSEMTAPPGKRMPVTESSGQRSIGPVRRHFPVVPAPNRRCSKLGVAVATAQSQLCRRSEPDDGSFSLSRGPDARLCNDDISITAVADARRSLCHDRDRQLAERRTNPLATQRSRHTARCSSVRPLPRRRRAWRWSSWF